MVRHFFRHFRVTVTRTVTHLYCVTHGGISRTKGIHPGRG
jgi:hypothetical protein